ncbi:hypothetical protein KAZ57_03465, partial [Patescibacteria group bacterium]|nr:hypothetical protein [Patescibacteria group bacterium]
MKPTAGFAHIALIAAVVVLVVGGLGTGAYFFYGKQKQSAAQKIELAPTEQTEYEKKTVETKVSAEVSPFSKYLAEGVTEKQEGKMDVDVDLKLDLFYKSSCGGGIECFEAAFSKCQPATLEIMLMESIVYFYDIKGPKDGYCEVTSKFLKNINPAFENVAMTCLY